jgi:dTDP-L-rhamnose 4-epimerase
MVGDVRDPEKIEMALRGVDAVIHLAAAVGVGQSMYEIERYTSVNNLGTAVLMEALGRHPVDRLIVASSMSIYGEGAYCDPKGRSSDPLPRTTEQLSQGRWEVYGSQGVPLVPIPTPESKPAQPSSVYALSKYDQERMALIVGAAYHIPTVALRFFNVYGPRQALSNPYTGVLAIFASRYLNGRPPAIFEDGRQQRDFVHVRDIAQACLRALITTRGIGHVFNIGSGHPVTVLQIADKLAEVLNCSSLEPQIIRRYRTGDVRHCFADITRARQFLGYGPQVSLEEGLTELAEWLAGQAPPDQTEIAQGELEKRGLTV